jgi:hypothetical protein
MRVVLKLLADGRVPRGLLGMAALVVLVESFINRHDRDFRSAMQWDWRLTGQAARGEAARCGILCFGDSMVKEGVAPRVLEERLGRPAYNLALGAGMTPAAYFLLRRALAAGARPAAIVLDCEPHLLALGYRSNDDQWPELIDARECLDQAWAARDAGFFARVMLARLFASIRDREQVRAHVRSAFRGEASVWRSHSPGFWRNWRINRGAQIMPVNTAFRGLLGAQHWMWFPNPWVPDPLAERFLHRFLGLAAASRIPVLWLLPPMAPAGQALREQIGLDASYTRFVERIQADFPNVRVIDGRRSGYGPEEFNDPFHLNRDGALSFSVAVAEVLARATTGAASCPRWVDLPHDRPRATGSPLEDLDQSVLAQQALDLGMRR